jgi:hypothetical protein
MFRTPVFAGVTMSLLFSVNPVAMVVRKIASLRPQRQVSGNVNAGRPYIETLIRTFRSISTRREFGAEFMKS